jgi:hypothetical protein
VTRTKRYRLARHAARQLADQRPRPRVFQRHPFQRRILLGRAGVEAHPIRFAAVQPANTPTRSILNRIAAASGQSGGDRTLQPELGGMITPLAGIVCRQLRGFAQQRAVFPVLRNLLAYLGQHQIALLIDGRRVLESVDEQLIEQWVRFYRVHHVRGLIDAEFSGDELKFLFQHLLHAVLDRIFQHEVDSTHHMSLSDSVDTADTLLHPQRIPRHIEVDDHMAELQVQALSAGVGRDQDPDVP